MSVGSVVGDVQTGDGWFGLTLALLNVFQTIVLAWMAGQRSRYRAHPNDLKALRSARETPEDGDV